MNESFEDYRGDEMQEDISKEEWIKRCAVRFVKCGSVDDKSAIEMAEACFNAEQNGFGNQEPLAIVAFDQGPEESADTDMSYWE